MDYEPSGPFITSLLELKLNSTTIFELQRASQGRTEVPPYSQLLDIFDLCAQASEAKVSEPYKHSVKLEYRKMTPPVKPVHLTFHPLLGTRVLLATQASILSNPAMCSKSMSHNQMVSLLKTHNFCLNCFKSGHFVKQCSSLHRCRKCQGLHHTLLHTVTSGRQSDTDSNAPPKLPPSMVSHVATGCKDNTSDDMPHHSEGTQWSLH